MYIYIFIHILYIYIYTYIIYIYIYTYIYNLSLLNIVYIVIFDVETMPGRHLLLQSQQ